MLWGVTALCFSRVCFCHGSGVQHHILSLPTLHSRASTRSARPHHKPTRALALHSAHYCAAYHFKAKWIHHEVCIDRGTGEPTPNWWTTNTEKTRLQTGSDVMIERVRGTRYPKLIIMNAGKGYRLWKNYDIVEDIRKCEIYLFSNLFFIFSVY